MRGEKHCQCKIEDLECAKKTYLTYNHARKVPELAMFKYWPRSRSSSEYSTTDLRLDVDATGGVLESRPRLKRVDLFLLRVKVSPVFSSRSSRSSSSRTSSSSRAYRHMLGFHSIKTNCTYLANDDAFYTFCASASSHLHLPESPRPCQ
jgi:hypothetical protein